MFTVKPHYIVAAAILLCCLGDVARGQTAAPNPQAIIKEVIAKYERVTSYQDSGVVRTLPGDPTLIADFQSSRPRGVSPREETLVSFRTYYARPRRIRFEWRSHRRRMTRDAAVWSDGERVYDWRPSPLQDDDSFDLSAGKDLRYYLGEAAKSSSGVALHVPTLLMSDLDPVFSLASYLSDMGEPSLLREEQIDGEPCYVIKGKIAGAPWVLWVGKGSRLLRKMRTLYTTASFHETLEKGTITTLIAEEIHRDIKINERIPEAVFKRRPQLRPDDSDLTRFLSGMFIPPVGRSLTTACTRRPTTESPMYVAHGRG